MAAPSPAQILYYEAHADEDAGGRVIATSIVCLVLAWAFIGLRFLARRMMKLQLMSDDWLVFCAGCTFAVFPISAIVGVTAGYGKHIIFVSDPKRMVETIVVGEISYALTIPLTKISILSLYNRIFPSRKLYLLSLAIAAITIAYSLALALVCFLQCIPLSTLWTADFQHGWCMNTMPPFTVTAVVNVITDIAILCLPVKFVWKLQMRWHRKVEVICLFALGGCVVVFGIVRSVEVGTASPIDQSWRTISGTIWSLIEPCIGIISACLPTLRPLLCFGRRTPSGYVNYTGSHKRSNSSNQHKFQKPILVPSDPNGRVWSTVTASANDLLTETDRHADEHELTESGPKGESNKHRTRVMNAFSQNEQHESEVDAIKTAGTKRSLSNIHVKQELHQEFSAA